MTSSFDILRQYAKEQPDAVAVVTPYRLASYRKMWSRIERSTARLHAEWGVRPGDTIAYFGCGHLDALVMYFAVARCGARLLPLEHPGLQQGATDLLHASAAVLVLHDDALLPDARALGVPCKPLSSLIATACRHRESVLEDEASISLLELPGDGGTPPGPPRERSLAALKAASLACPAGHRVVEAALFDTGVFAPVVLASLLTGAALTLGGASVESDLRTSGPRTERD